MAVRDNSRHAITMVCESVAKLESSNDFFDMSKAKPPTASTIQNNKPVKAAKRPLKDYERTLKELKEQKDDLDEDRPMFIPPFAKKIKPNATNQSVSKDNGLGGSSFIHKPNP